jgi:D-alanyl-D-alanine carboxypeptidase
MRQPPSRFPIVAQLVVLGLILTLGFSFLWYRGAANAPAVAAVSTMTTSQSLVTHSFSTIKNVDISASSAFVLDAATGHVLYEKNAHTPRPIASITKLMTAYLASELIAAEDSLTVTHNAVRQDGDSGLRPNEQFTRKDIEQLVLIPSSNDAAYALAEHAGGTLGDDARIAQFVAAMNIRAEELGYDSFVFSNMTGLDESTTQAGAIGSASDVSYFVRHILQTKPEILTPTREGGARIINQTGQVHSAANTNVIYDRIPNLLASKTGFTDLAGGNLTIAFDAGNNRPIIVTVLDSTFDKRFTDVLTLVAALETE